MNPTGDANNNDPVRVLSVVGLLCQILVVVMEVFLLGTTATQLALPSWS